MHFLAQNLYMCKYELQGIHYFLSITRGLMTCGVIVLFVYSVKIRSVYYCVWPA